MPVTPEKMMNALFAAVVAAMFLQPLASPQAQARIERALAAVTWENVAALNICGAEGLDCSQLPTP
jgi:hypothetical protein